MEPHTTTTSKTKNQINQSFYQSVIF